MEKEVIQLGKSLAVILPKAIASRAGLKRGSRVDITERGRNVQIRRADHITPVHLQGIVSTKGIRAADFEVARRKIHGQFTKKWKSF